MVINTASLVRLLSVLALLAGAVSVLAPLTAQLQAATGATRTASR
jgi:hypothetical protein